VSPGYSIVPGDPVEHKRDVLGLADRNLLTPMQGREARYLKYYERNPVGPPCFFLAREDRSGAFVGMAAAFPTRLRVFGELVPGAISGDFAVDDGHRGFGPSLALQRAVVSALVEDGVRCTFGYPNEFSEPIVKRVGYADLGRLSRFVKVLKSRVVVDAYASSHRLARVGTALSTVAVDPFLSLFSRERLHRRRHGFRVEQPDAFDESFSDLWEATWRQQTITSERNPELLNWKYEREGNAARPAEPAARAQPRSGVFTIFALVGEDDRVAGYAVHRTRNGIRHLLDVTVLPSRAVVDAFLSELIRDARRDGAAAITTLYLGSANMLTGRLRAFGFVRRTDQSGLRVYVAGESQLDKELVESDNWYFLTGDADV
jgi:GNAT superfamily N-acetyltransferase